MLLLLLLLGLAFGLGGVPGVPWDGWHSLDYGPASVAGLVALLGVVFVLLEQT